MKLSLIDALALAGAALVFVGLYRVSLTLLILVAGASLLGLAISLAHREARRSEEF